MHLKAAIDEFILYIQIEKNYSPHTIDSYEYDLNQFLAFLQDHNCSTDLAFITKTQVRRFIPASARNPQAKTTVHEQKNFLFKVFHQILHTGKIPLA